MRSIDIFAMAIRNLFKRKVRTLLASLGVVVGTACIVVMISLGIGVNLSFETQLEQMGDLTIVNIYSNAYYSDNANSKFLRDEDINNIMKLKGVVTASPTLQTNLAIVAGKYMANVQIVGIRPEAMAALGYDVTQGELLSPEKKFGIVFGTQSPYEFMTERERRLQEQKWRGGGRVMMMSGPMGGNQQEEQKAPNVDLFKEKLQASYVPGFGENQGSSGNEDENDQQTNKPIVKPYTLQALGIMKQTNDYRTTYWNYMNLNTVKQMIDERTKYEQAISGTPPKKTVDKGYQEAFVKCTDIDAVSKVIEEIKAMGFPDVWGQAEYINEMKKTAGSLQLLLGASGAVALFVAAIGIANTMFMSMYERTREIGVMKVIGAALKDIRSLFLLEAATIGFLGGMIGILLSLLASYLLNHVDIAILKMFGTYGSDIKISVIPLWLCGSALLFTTIVGLVSGYIPARRAMKISALSAIKSE